MIHDHFCPLALVHCPAKKKMLSNIIPLKHRWCRHCFANLSKSHGLGGYWIYEERPARSHHCANALRLLANPNPSCLPKHKIIHVH